MNRVVGRSVAGRGRWSGLEPLPWTEQPRARGACMTDYEEGSSVILTPARGVVTPTEEDVLTEQDIRRVREFQAFLRDLPAHRARLVGDDGAAMEMPEPIVKVLRRVVPLMAEGAALGLAPLYQELTTQQAAGILNISRPSLIKLLAADEIPHSASEGGHRRIRFVDVLEYKRRRSETRRAACAEMAAIGEAYGAYDAHADDGLCDADTDEAGALHSVAATTHRREASNTSSVLARPLVTKRRRAVSSTAASCGPVLTRGEESVCPVRASRTRARLPLTTP